MKSYLAGSNDAGLRLDRFLCKALPHLPPSLLQRSIREKRVRVDGVRAADPARRLASGEAVQIYLGDGQLNAPAHDRVFQLIKQPVLDIVYEDANLLLVYKPAGMLCQPDAREAVHTLTAHIQAYLFQRGGWDPQEENTFAPSLCHRIDRNTSGIVMAAKNAPALAFMNEKIKAREVRKEYLCVLRGVPVLPSGTLRDHLSKNTSTKMVYLHKPSTPGAVEAITHYEVLAVRDGLSLVRCELVTGRTHQIRAQWAARGHPLLGDGKYGPRPIKGEQTRQALCAYQVTFQFASSDGVLGYLQGKRFTLPRVDFAEAMFGWIL
jgi:23S rRNA pseudouridine955/2504/2580 synthase